VVAPQRLFSTFFDFFFFTPGPPFALEHPPIENILKNADFSLLRQTDSYSPAKLQFFPGFS